ncbi:hypothetical protein HZY91_01405 [Facklamia sp. DSM 111018]|uniref:DUF1307 domain-containing protein n=1 Tax=Facklamia lactis TaxID=2749967 RepID=A0ABS0LN08_9LACT|nr:hypothetical protein [Facklamia lactis]MBG9985548.1 hypothetical protein [Facklamia lactis]
MKRTIFLSLLVLFLFAFTSSPEVSLLKKTNDHKVYVSYDISQEDTVENLKVEYVLNDSISLSDKKGFLKEKKTFENKIKRLIPKQDKFQIEFSNQSLLFTFKGKVSLQGMIQSLPILTLSDDKAHTLEKTLLENGFIRIENKEN